MNKIQFKKWMHLLGQLVWLRLTDLQEYRHANPSLLPEDRHPILLTKPKPDSKEKSVIPTSEGEPQLLFAKEWSKRMEVKSWKKVEEVLLFITSYMSTTKIWNANSLSVLGYENDKEKQQGERIPALYRSKYLKEGSRNMYAEADRLRMPFRWIPNCSRFEIQVGGLDWLFALFGKHKRTEGEIKIRNWRNLNSNRFLYKRFLELGHLRDTNQQAEYWKSGWRLMGSRAYQVSALNYVMSGWYKNRSLTQVLKVLTKVEQLVKARSTELEFHRAYIPKPNTDKVRPLGVPTLEWRIYLHMLNNLVVWARTGREGRQHAYFPGRGVITAWEEVMKLKDAPNIYEFDLTGFFDNVDLNYLANVQEKYFGWPKEIADWFERLNQRLVKLSEKDLKHETDRDVFLDNDNKLNPGLRQSWKNRYNMLNRSPHVWYGRKKYGIPQGAATSCGQSTMSLVELTNFEPKEIGLSGPTTMYADDGLYFTTSDSLLNLRVTFDAIGSPINISKSSWVKKDGKWLKPLKYLGLEYDGNKDSFTAHTRSGSRREFTTLDQFLSFLADWRNKVKYEGSASHLNKWDHLPYTWGDWTLSGLREFGKLKEYSTLLFGHYKGYFVNQLYNESKREGDSTLHLTHSQCWIIREWPYYKWKLLQSSATMHQLVWYELKKLGIEAEKDLIPPRGSTSLSELKRSLEEVKSSIRGIRYLTRKLSSLSHSLNLMEETQHLIGDESSHRLRLSTSDWKSLSELLPLTLHNASTFACDSLLNRDVRKKWASSLRNRWGEEIKLKMYMNKEWSLFKDRTALASYLENNAPKKTQKRSKRKSREFLREVGAKLLD